MRTSTNIQHPRPNNPEPLVLGLGDVNVSPRLRATAQATVLVPRSLLRTLGEGLISEVGTDRGASEGERRRVSER